MTKIAYFDCFAGISGDMIIGALLDAGLELSDLQAGLAKLGLDGYELKCQPVQKAGLQALSFRVLLETGTGQAAADADYVETELLDSPLSPETEHQSVQPVQLPALPGQNQSAHNL